MSSYKVTFLPDGETVEAEDGATIMEAAQKAGVYINSLCGGKGVCGKCRVQIANGRVRADKNSISFLSKEEVREGYALACQAKVDGDIEETLSVPRGRFLLPSSPLWIMSAWHSRI